MLSQIGSQKPILSYNTGPEGTNTYKEGTANINVSSKSGPKPILGKKDTNLCVLGVIMAQQFSLKAGMQKFGNRGEKAVSKELTQLHDKIAYVPVNPEELTAEQKNDVMRSLCLLTKKRDGTIKAKEVADCSSQQRRPGYKK